MTRTRLLGLSLLLLGVTIQEGLAREYTRLPLPKGIQERFGEVVLSGEIAYSPHGDRLAVPSSVGIWIHDARTGRLKSHLDTSFVRPAVFSPDGRTLAAGTRRAIRLWEVDTGQLKAVLDGHAGFVRSAAFSPDGETLASGSGDHTIRLWAVDTGQLETILYGHTGEVESVAFSPDGKTLASGGGDYTIRLWDVASGQQRAALHGHSGWIESVAFSPDGRTLASGGWDGTIRLWDAGSGEPRTTLLEQGRYGVAGWVWSLAFVDAGTLASGHDDGVRLWNAETGQLESTLTLEGHGSWVSSVAVAPNGRTLASGSRTGHYTVLLWDISSRMKMEATVTGGRVEGLTVEFSRSISGRRPHYAWTARTDAAGRLELTLFPGHSGLYQARARGTDGQVVGRWHSIPLNRGIRQSVNLTLGGDERTVAVGPESAAKAAAPDERADNELYPNQPNPFNGGTRIAYRLAGPGPVRLEIYNLMGQQVRTLVDEVQAAGLYEVSWDGRDRRGLAVAAGIYLARLDYPGGAQTRRLMYLK